MEFGLRHCYQNVNCGTNGTTECLLSVTIRRAGLARSVRCGSIVRREAFVQLLIVSAASFRSGCDLRIVLHKSGHFAAFAAKLGSETIGVRRQTHYTSSHLVKQLASQLRPPGPPTY